LPYIKSDRRHAVNNWLQLAWAHADNTSAIALAPDSPSGPQDCGELNYALTMTCIAHDTIKFGALDDRLKRIAEWYATSQPIRYQRINDIVGACECAAMELERRRPGAKKMAALTLHYLSRHVYAHIAIAYEIQKIAENGDINYGG
jgi:hypothetical protein